MSLVAQFASYSAWRNRVSAFVADFRQWLVEHEFSDPHSDLRLEQLLARLRDDRLHVAFVAEFSRGKSELINALFFSEFGCRVLPSAAGRTTMCPTEFAYDAVKPACIELLPIQTRATHATVSEYKGFPESWRRVPLDTTSGQAMRASLGQVSETLRVSVEEARELGFELGDDGQSYRIGPDGLVEVPRWRHAQVNFPHPLLEQGLVILDTPGLNAIGAEPELTLSLLPSAHALVFVLGADTGLTQSDLQIWKDHLSAGLARGCLLVLNKIDGQWDELKTGGEVEAEIQQIATHCANLLGVAKERVFPVSAQKGLLARINGDRQLLARSRLEELEAALSQGLIPAKQEIVGNNVESEIGQLAAQVWSRLRARQEGLDEQLAELKDLRGKNRNVVEYMMGKVRAEKTAFDAGLQRFSAARSIFAALSAKLVAHLAIDALRQRTRETRANMRGAAFSKTLSVAMDAYFADNRQAAVLAQAEVTEIGSMLTAVFAQFAKEHGLKLDAPQAFALDGLSDEIARLENWCNSHLNSALALLTTDKAHLTQKFFDGVAIQMRKAFDLANREAERWLRAVLEPLEAQVREHHLQLKRRVESIGRIHQATETLEERIAELQGLLQAVATDQAALEVRCRELDGLLSVSSSPGERRIA